MIPIFVINLEADHERLAFIHKELDALGLAWERVAAVNGKSIPAETVRLENKRTRNRRLSSSELGCLLSHVNVWKRIVEQKIPAALIMEDDIMVSPAIKPLLEDISWLPSDDCIVRLETFLMPVVLGKKIADVHGCGLHQMRSIQHGSAGYIITEKRAAAALECYTRYIDAADHMVFRYPMESNTYQLCPAPCIQYGIYVHGHVRTHSTLEMERVITKRLSLYEADTMIKHLSWKLTSLIGIMKDVLRGYSYKSVPYCG